MPHNVGECGSRQVPSRIDAPCTNAMTTASVCIRGQQRIGGRLSFRKSSAISPCRRFHARPLTQSYLIRSKNRLAATAARQEGGGGRAPARGNTLVLGL